MCNGPGLRKCNNNGSVQWLTMYSYRFCTARQAVWQPRNLAVWQHSFALKSTACDYFLLGHLESKVQCTALDLQTAQRGGSEIVRGWCWTAAPLPSILLLSYSSSSLQLAYCLLSWLFTTQEYRTVTSKTMGVVGDNYQFISPTLAQITISPFDQQAYIKVRTRLDNTMIRIKKLMNENFQNSITLEL